MATTTINNPFPDQVYVTGEPVHVIGHVVGDGLPEPSQAQTVTVTVDGGAPVEATVTIVPVRPGPGPHPPPTATFSAVAPVPDRYGFYNLTAKAVMDNHKSAEASVTIIRGDPAVSALTPQGSLEVTATNPAPPPGGAANDWADNIVTNNQTPINSLLTGVASVFHGTDFPVSEREWTQVTAPHEDYDDQPVAFSGWLLQPEISGNDVRFDHPFGFDWECMVALDGAYQSLLAPGNAIPDGADGQQAKDDANRLAVPVPQGGLLAVETDGECVPLAFNPLINFIRIGDRIAILGRWIVDAGHSVLVADPTPAHPFGTTSYRAEVHPPMLMAIGGTRQQPPGEPVTRIMLTSRPFLAKQVYSVDTGAISDDNAPNDGGLLEHLNREIDKLHNAASTTIEAHPKIAAKPFRGVHLFRMRVRPPAASVVGGVVASELQVSFQFTCRSEVAVQVLPAADGVDVVVVVNSLNYAPFPLPERQTVVVGKAELQDASALVTLEQIVSLFSINVIGTGLTEQALAHGIETDFYGVPDVDVIDRSHAVGFVPAGSIPGGQGIVVDDSQPYPVFGWIEVRRHRPDVVIGGRPVLTGR
jgi:hypothetical protein